jgi:hypothetical protein
MPFEESRGKNSLEKIFPHLFFIGGELFEKSSPPSPRSKTFIACGS